MPKNDMKHDAGIQFWGGTMDEGLSMSSRFCPGYNEVAGYIDKMLPAKLRKNVEEHMAACKECRIDVYDIKLCIRETA